VLLIAAVGAAAADDLTLEKCAGLVRDDPDELESYQCYWVLARGGDWDGAVRALEALLAIDPSNHRARLYLAAIEADLGHERAERLYREAANGFAVVNDPVGEAYSRKGLYHILMRADRLPEAREELESAAQIASDAGDPALRARIWVTQAYLDKEAGDYGSALTLLRKAEAVAFPDGPIELQSHILESLGHAYWAQGLRERALETYRRQAEIVERAGLVYYEVTARYNIALLSAELSQRGRTEHHDHVQRIERALELAVRVGNRRVEARSRLLLGQALGGEREIEEYTRALEISRTLGHRTLTREIQGRLAFQLWLFDPERRREAFHMVEGLLEDARTSADLRNHAYALLARAAMLFDSGSGPREDWIDAYRRAIDAVEKIRNLRPEGTVGARLFARWSRAYHRFSAKLLDGLPGSPDPAGDLDLAFRTVERMRSRLLIDALDAGGADPWQSVDHPKAGRRAEILEEIARIQRELADSSLPSDERTSRLETLGRLEMEEAALRGEIARVDSAFAALHSPVFPRLEEIRERLAPDQAVLSYQLYYPDSWMKSVPRDVSWVILVTGDGTSAFPLPEKELIEKRVSALLGLIRRRDGSETIAARVLFDDLLGEPLRAAGPEVRRLVIVPDDCLHRLPFAALRSEIDDDPLGARYEISVVPSVTAWMRWRDEQIGGVDASDEASVLALADPELTGAPGDDPLRSGDPWLRGLHLGPLPHARSEARRMVRTLGGNSRLLSGPEATERILKSTDLDPFRILHLAAHAVVDHEHPERSAVVLAPGGENEDGFLQMREIVDLDLRDRVIILSACQSASGTILEGEGMLGLARAFFQAGARAVIGSLWPMRDDEAEVLMNELSGRIARGQTLSRALAGARAELIGNDVPAEAWASLALLGDGDFAPVPKGPNSTRSSALWVLPILGLALLASAGALLYRRFRT
jgi:CHAT domain-containing protein/tetratricopeptide (TPR) repeat protein